VVAPGSGSRLRNAVPATDAAARDLLARSGYEQVWIFWHMARELGTIEDPVIPPGIAMRDYRHDTDADAFFDALDEAFADHWSSEPYPRDVHMDEIQRSEPSLVGVALDGERIVGGLIAREVEGDQGWVDVVGVRRPWRGRGVAQALLLRAFGALATRGAASVALNVDADSQTGATHLYERVGMHIRREWRLYERQLHADEGGRRHRWSLLHSRSGFDDVGGVTDFVGS
jgi:ribosomal protein S18 acetylase RimI-like enzyme